MVCRPGERPERPDAAWEDFNGSASKDHESRHLRFMVNLISHSMPNLGTDGCRSPEPFGQCAQTGGFLTVDNVNNPHEIALYDKNQRETPR